MTQGHEALRGLTVLVTRPAGQGQDLSRLMSDSGAGVVHLPLLEIQALADPAPAKARLQGLRDCDLAIFVSRNAVDQADALAGGQLSQWSRDTEVASIGRATSAALARARIRVSLEAPPPFNSESLLGILEDRDLHGWRILIIRGVGGREALGQALTRRGAELEYVEVYRRVAPSYAPDRIQAVLGDGVVDLITITSAEALQNLLSLAAAAGIALSRQPVLVASQRIAELARRSGLEQIQVAQDATDPAMYEAVLSWATQT